MARRADSVGNLLWQRLGAPPVSRALRLVTVDPLQSEKALNITADHGQGALQWQAADSSRASALYASIDHLQDVCAAMTAPDARERRRLTPRRPQDAPHPGASLGSSERSLLAAGP